MNRTFFLLVLVCATFVISPQAALAVNIAWVPVGNAGNANDPNSGYQYGAVAYNYSIDKYDVTNSQYVAFLNSNVPNGELADPLELYNSNMSNGANGGIDYNSGAAIGSRYSVISGRGDYPVNYVTFYDALRFANWLNNGQIPGSTESGAYTLLGGTPTPSNGDSVSRNPGATIVLPRENEWYKAAYYNPTTNSYYRYPTSSDTIPWATTPTSTPNAANFSPGGPNKPTAVGAYSGTTSPYGAYDMGGNVVQWNEAVPYGSTRGLSGSPYFMDYSFLSGAVGIGWNPTDQVDFIGFRVAAVPEPTSGMLAALGMLIGFAMLRRRGAPV